MSDKGVEHTPVLLPQVLAALDIRASGVYMDATFGRGGHAGAILEKLVAEGRLLCLDRDPVAVADARSRFAADPRVSVFLAPFSSLAACADAIAPGLKFDGILFDLGVSSPQLDDASRGFSFMQDGPLDMRMSKGVGQSAADVVNGASEAELIRIFREFGEERFAPRIARAIVADRETKPFERTLELAEMISRVARSRDTGGRDAGAGRPGGRPRHKHPATRVFQALRIHVNGELDELETALQAAFERLAPRGRLAVISFHSLEDRIVKQFMRRHASTDPVYAGLPFVPAHAAPKLRLVGKAVQADSDETARNPRARSARLRVAERLSEGLAA
jgi:16S rRNA (cytosine1402-N4)-methyltransferase